MTGICLVNLVHGGGAPGDFLPLNCRVYAPEQDARTRKEHFQSMFVHVVAEAKIQARTLLFDAWYSGSDNPQLIHRAGWTFFTTLQRNRLVSASKERGYPAPDAVAAPPGSRWSTGLDVRLKQVPFAVRLFDSPELQATRRGPKVSVSASPGSAQPSALKFPAATRRRESGALKTGSPRLCYAADTGPGASNPP